MEERARQELMSSKTKTFHIAKHGYYRKTCVDSVAQEMQSALPGGVVKVHEDTDEDDEPFDDLAADVRARRFEAPLIGAELLRLPPALA